MKRLFLLATILILMSSFAYADQYTSEEILQSIPSFSDIELEIVIEAAITEQNIRSTEPAKKENYEKMISTISDDRKIAEECFYNAELAYKQAQNFLAHNKYDEAAKVFDSLNGYEDASIMAMYCKAILKIEAGDYETGLQVLKSIEDFKDVSFRLSYYTAQYYEDIAIHDNNFEMMEYAIELYNQNPLFLDSDVRISILESKIEETKQMLYENAIIEAEAKQYDSAIYTFEQLDEFADSRMRAVYYKIRKEEDAIVDGDFAAMLNVSSLYANHSDFLDSKVRATTLRENAEACMKILYDSAVEDAQAGNYDNAILSFETLGTYANSAKMVRYYTIRQAEENINTNDINTITNVCCMYLDLGEFLDSQERAKSLADIILKIETSFSASNNVPITLPNIKDVSKAEVFYTPNGTFYHSKANCSGMINSTSHTLQEALTQNKKECTSCNVVSFNKMECENYLWIDIKNRAHTTDECPYFEPGPYRVLSFADLYTGSYNYCSECKSDICYAYMLQNNLSYVNDNVIMDDKIIALYDFEKGITVYYGQNSRNYHANAECMHMYGDKYIHTLYQALHVDMKQACTLCKPLTENQAAQIIIDN